MRFIPVLLITSLFQLPAHAASTTLPDECAAQSQADMRHRLETKSKDSEAALIQAENATFSTLRQWDEDDKFVATADATLKAASKSFIQFRDAQCRFAASLGGGAAGNALALRKLACVVALNRLQAASLQQAVASLPRK